MLAPCRPVTHLVEGEAEKVAVAVVALAGGSVGAAVEVGEA